MKIVDRASIDVTKASTRKPKWHDAHSIINRLTKDQAIVVEKKDWELRFSRPGAVLQAVRNIAKKHYGKTVSGYVDKVSGDVIFFIV